MIILETILSGFIILASKGSINRLLSRRKNGLLKIYLVIISFFLLFISFFYQSEVTLSPLWKNRMMNMSNNSEIKYDLQLSIPQILMQIIDSRGLRMVNNYPIMCLNFRGVCLSCFGSLNEVNSCIFLPFAIVSNMFGQKSVDSQGFDLIFYNNFFSLSIYQSTVLFSSNKSSIYLFGSWQGYANQIQIPLDSAMAMDLKQNLKASMIINNSGTESWSSLTLESMKNSQINCIFLRCCIILLVLAVLTFIMLVMRRINQEQIITLTSCQLVIRITYILHKTTKRATNRTLSNFIILIIYDAPSYSSMLMHGDSPTNTTQDSLLFLILLLLKIMDTSDAKIRTRTISHRSALKSSLASQKYLSRFTTEQTPRKTTLLPPNQEFTSWEFLQARRESQLNTMFNTRKHKLDEITKANYAIYDKINTQQSHYPKKLSSIINNKLAHSRFQTIDQSNIENRKVLGPISNFRALPKTIHPLQQINNTCQFDANQWKSKAISQARLHLKPKLKFKHHVENEEEGLPMLFQFY